jgi:hypothetical protein
MGARGGRIEEVVSAVARTALAGKQTLRRRGRMIRRSQRIIAEKLFPIGTI